MKNGLLHDYLPVPEMTDADHHIQKGDRSLLTEAHESENRRNSEQHENKEPQDVSLPPGGGGFCEAVFNHPRWPDSIPNQPHSTNERQFVLARIVKEAEGIFGRPATNAEHRAIFDHWYAQSHLFLRSEVNSAGYFLEYLVRYGAARKPISHSTREAAWEKSKDAPPIPEVEKMFGDDPKVMALAKLMRELAIASRDSSFFLGTRDAGRLLGISQRTAATWILGFARAGFIRQISPVGHRICPVYAWCIPIPTTENRAEDQRHEPPAKFRIKI